MSTRGILTYHSLDTSGSPISVDPGVFASHVRWLASRAVPVVPLHTLMTLPPSADAIALTFDDAYANFGVVAAPLLVAAGLPATVFVVTERVGMTNAWPRGSDDGVPQLSLLDWDELGSLAAAGVSIGAHSRSHPRLACLERDAELQDEIAGSGAEIERRIGARPRAFAYPYGSVSAGVARVVRASYDLACTTTMRAVAPHDDAMLLPRLDAYYFRRPGLLESWGTPRFTRYVQARALGRRVRLTLSAVGKTA